MLELLSRDCSGRISKLTLGDRNIVLPELAVVINPGKMIITPAELKKEFGAKLIITNAYLIKRSRLMEDISKRGLHDFLNFDGMIMTDSGAYQTMFGSSINLTNKEIIEFQEKIKPDIGTFLDVTSGDLKYDDAKKTVLETIKRAKECKLLTENSKISWMAPIQGGEHLDLVKKCAKSVGKLDFDAYAIGSIVPKMIRYDFKTVCQQIITAKMNIPSNKPLHAFGLGLPSFMSLAVAIGSDIFDSAAYALYAYDNRYMTNYGTHRLEELIELPCSCPICTKYTVKELIELENSAKVKELARHNLYVTFAELRSIRQAIRDNSLWELVQQRARAHPALLEALQFVLKKYRKYLLGNEPISKKSALRWCGEESKYRPEVLRAKKMVKGVKSKKYFVKKPFGKVPIELKGVYPFGQSIVPDQVEPIGKASNSDIVNKTIEYQFSSKFKTSFSTEVSRKTGRIRRVWKNKKLLGTIRPHDGFFIPTLEGSKYIKMKTVEVPSEILEHVKSGRSLFTKFVERTDDIYPGEEVLIVSDSKPIITGMALLNKKEIKDFKKGVAVKLR